MSTVVVQSILRYQCRQPTLPSCLSCTALVAASRVWSKFACKCLVGICLCDCRILHDLYLVVPSTFGSRRGRYRGLYRTICKSLDASESSADFGRVGSISHGLFSRSLTPDRTPGNDRLFSSRFGRQVEVLGHWLGNCWGCFCCSLLISGSQLSQATTYSHAADSLWNSDRLQEDPCQRVQCTISIFRCMDCRTRNSNDYDYAHGARFLVWNYPLCPIDRFVFVFGHEKSRFASVTDEANLLIIRHRRP